MITLHNVLTYDAVNIKRNKFHELIREFATGHEILAWLPIITKIEFQNIHDNRWFRISFITNNMDSSDENVITFKNDLAIEWVLEDYINMKIREDKHK